MINKFSLKNGIKVVTYSIPQMRSVYLDITVKGGSFLDNKDKDGVAHFMEHVLVQGTPSFPTVQELSDYIESLAGTYNAYTSNETVRFCINLPGNYLENAIKIASEVFFEPLLTPQSIEKERVVIFSEIKRAEDTLGFKINKFFKENRYKETHPIQRDILGTIDTVDKLTREDLLEYWESQFDPQNTYIVIVGQLDNKVTEQLIEKYFQKVEAKNKFKGFRDIDIDEFSNFNTAIRFDDKLNSVYLDISAPSLVSGESSIEDEVKQQLLRSVLGGLGSSRLYRLLRYDKGLVYHTGFSIGTWQKWGFVDAFTQVDPNNLNMVLELMVKEIKSYLEKGPTKEELDFAKNYHINRTLMQFDHPSNIASWISGDLMWEDRIYTPEEYAKLIEEVKLDGLVDFMDRKWDFSKLNLTIQGPIENTEKNNEKYTNLVKDLYKN